jgi:hypothetical protein
MDVKCFITPGPADESILNNGEKGGNGFHFETTQLTST